MSIPYTLNDTGITYFLKGQKTFRRDFPQFEELKNAVISGDVKLIEKIANPRQYVAKISNGNVVITTDDEVLYKGNEVPEYLALRILNHAKNNVPLEPLFAFTEKLMLNPNVGVRTDLFRWLEKGQMPIYPDGDFLAYKKVRNDYTPIHVGGQYGQLQKVGMTVEQPRETCNANRSETCSSGLHFCSFDYLGNFSAASNDRIIVLKINPQDVVAIPNDYNDTKGRTCRFHIIDEIVHTEIKDTFGGKLVADSKAPVNTAKNQNNRAVAEKALDEAGNNKTKAAESLGISRSTLTRWLAQPKVVEEPVDDLDESYEYVVESYEEDSWGDSWDEEDNSDDIELSNYDKAVEALSATQGNKTQAANALGVSRSTLTRWLKG